MKALTDEKLKAKLIKLIRLYKRINKLVDEIQVGSEKEINFGATGLFTIENEILVQNGVKKIANLLEQEAVKSKSGCDEFKNQLSTNYLDVKISQIF